MPAAHGSEDVCGVRIREARWPLDAPLARRLLEQYFASLADNVAVPVRIREKDRAQELRSLEQSYTPERAVLLLAFLGEQPSGCAAVSLLSSRTQAAELKRLYVEPEARGHGVGRALIQACAGWAREHGARELLLDTLPEAMPEAVGLYRSLGFAPTERYNENEGCCFAFFRLGLL